MSGFVNFLTWLRERPRLLLGLFLGLLGAIILYDFLAVRGHAPHFVGDRIRTFWALFGFLGAVGMTKFMKWLSAMFVAQPLDFYSRNEGGEE